MGTEAFGRERGDGSNFFLTFFLMIYLKNKSSYDSNDFFHIGMKACGGEQLFVS